MKEFERQIGYEFHDQSLLRTALTHSSYAAEGGGIHDVVNNERLEFLGDAFLDLIVGEELYLRLKDGNEGTLTQMRASIVCEESLAAIGEGLDLGKALFLGKGEEMTGGRTRSSIVSDGVEAVVGAIYLDGGYEVGRSIVLALFKETIGRALDGDVVSDYKSIFQEQLQKKGSVNIEYRIIDEEGPPHNRIFNATVSADGKLMGRGLGKTKKEAEKQAAKEALENYLDKSKEKKCTSRG